MSLSDWRPATLVKTALRMNIRTVNQHVVVFAKVPRMGRVKTRLAHDIGFVKATAFYRQSLAHTLRTIKGNGRWTVWLAIAPDTAKVDPVILRLATTAGAQIIPQGVGDLGDRMDRVMHLLPPGPAVVIGTDIVGLTAAHIDAAFTSLGNHDAAFGPAPDGGYWLVGLKRTPIILRPFAPVRWSSQHALADTISNLPQDCRVAMLSTLNDVDTAADLPRANTNRADN